MLRPEQTDTRCVQRDEPTRPGSSSSLPARVTSYNAHDRLLQSKPSRSKPRALTSPGITWQRLRLEPGEPQDTGSRKCGALPCASVLRLHLQPASPSTEGGGPVPSTPCLCRAPREEPVSGIATLRRKGEPLLGVRWAGAVSGGTGTARD